MNAPNDFYKIQARYVKFDFSDTPVTWIPKDPYATHIINTLNLLFPEGELWFCRIYNKALPYITDPKLKSDAEGFLRQEAVHSRSHNTMLKHYYDTHGLDTKPFTNRIQWLFTTLGGDRPLGIFRRGGQSRVWLRLRLGVIASLEHFFGYAGNWILNAEALERDADPAVLDLLRWHGAEEVEHRTVAFDIYNHLGGSYLERCLTMSFTLPLLIYLSMSGAKWMYERDPSTGRYPGFFFAWDHAAKQGHLPSFLKLLFAGLRYYLPGYTPAKEGSTEQALAYLATSPAAQAAALSGGHWTLAQKTA